MRILVAGAAGQVALSLAEASKALVEAGRARDVDLIALGRPDLDLTREGDVVRVVADVKPDVVINAAAFTAVDRAESEPDAAHLLNATAAGWLAREAARADAPILHLSTDYVFDGAKPVPYLEDDAVRPLGVYGASKLAGERAVATANPRHLLARTAWVYSPFGKNFVRTMLHLASDREELTVVADQIGNPTYAPHIAEAMLAIASQCVKPDGVGNRWGVFHLVAPDETTWADLAEATFAESAARGGASARVRRITAAEYPTLARRPQNSRLDANKLQRIYGIRLPPWRVGVAACVGRIIGEA